MSSPFSFSCRGCRLLPLFECQAYPSRRVDHAECEEAEVAKDDVVVELTDAASMVKKTLDEVKATVDTVKTAVDQLPSDTGVKTAIDALTESVAALTTSTSALPTSDTIAKKVAKTFEKKPPGWAITLQDDAASTKNDVAKIRKSLKIFLQSMAGGKK